MKKISVILTMTLLLCIQAPSQAGVCNNFKARIEQNKIHKTQTSEIKALFNEQIKQANKHNLEGLLSTYSKDYTNSDGFYFDTYVKMVEETWKTYPDITYSTDIKDINISDNYARVHVIETAVSAPKEVIGDFETVGELYSVSECVYHLEKHGAVWLISAEDMLNETSTLKYGRARYTDIKLNAPKQIGAGKYYTTTLKIDMPEGFYALGSISKENIVYPQNKPDDNFRPIYNENTLERVFSSNKDNVNEYVIASIGITHTQKSGNDLKLYMDGLAFIMTRVNVIPENKFVKEKK